MKSYFEELVSEIHKKEWRFSRDINAVVKSGSQFLVTAVLEESPNDYVVGLYGKTNPEIDTSMCWYAFHFHTEDEIFELFTSVDFVQDHSEFMDSLFSPITEKMNNES